MELRDPAATGAVGVHVGSVPSPASLSSPVARNVGWLLIAQAFAGGSQFALAVVLARHLGPEAYGQWVFAFAFVALFSVLADFGFSVVAVRDLARDERLTASYLGNILLLKLALAVPVVVAIGAIEPLLRRDIAVWFLVMLLSGQMLLTSLSQFLFSAFRARDKTYYEAAARAVHAVLLLALAAGLVSRGAQIHAFGWAALAAAGLGLVFTSAVVVSRFARPTFHLDPALCRRLLREVWPIGLGLALTAIYYYADSVMLGVLGQTQEVGWYGAAYTPILGIVLMVGVLRNAYLPSQARARHEAKEMRAKLLRQYGAVTASLALPVAVAGPLVAEPVLDTLFGQEYAAAGTALRLLFLTSGVMFFSSYFGSELLVGNRQRTYLLGVGAGAGLNLVLNAALIPSFGLEGAATATLASEGLVCSFMWWQNGPGFVNKADVARTGAGSCVMGAVLFGTMQVVPLFAAVGTAAAVYLGALHLSGFAPWRRQGWLS